MKIESGKQMFTNRALVGLAVPVILDALLAIMAGMIDSAMVSSAGEAAVSAVSLVDAVNLLFTAIISALAIGGSVITAQYIGRKSFDKASTSANQLLYASTAMALVCMLLLLCFRENVLSLIYGGIEADVFKNASTYFGITLLGYPFFAIGCSSGAVLRAMGKNRQSVAIAVTANLCNVAGNAILIYGFHMGVTGAAISTAFHYVVWAVSGLILTHRKELPAHFEKLLRFRLDWEVMKRVLKIGVTNGLENGMFHIGKVLIASLVSSFSTVAIAAYSVSATLNNFGWTIIGAFGTVLLTVVGQCVGAKEYEQARAYTKKLLIAASACMFLIFGSIVLLRNQLVLLFNFEPATLEACAYYTGISALFSIVAFYAYSFVPTSAFRAAGDLRYAVTVSIVSMFAFRVLLCYILNAIFPQLGLMCVYIGMGVDWLVRSVLNFFHFRSGKWLQKQLI